MTREELIAALERAEGLSWELDGDIAGALGLEMPSGVPPWQWPPRYTASIDAALTLAEDGLLLETERAPNGDWRVWITPNEDEQWFGSGKTAAIALCIAALRAREDRDDGR